uniref:ThuA-like domain-containing protein n=1 Tax=Schlesneria paludicola TaxID=360056 RepID=A0A7C2P3N2_9PLAN
MRVLSRSSLWMLVPILTAAAQLAPAAEPVKPLRVLLVLGGCCHDYAAQNDVLRKGLTERAHVEVVSAYDPDRTTMHLNPVYENPNWAAGFDAVIHDECTSDVKDLAVIDRILEPHRQGLPAVLLHCGMHSYRSEGYPKAVTPWFEFTGLQSTGHGPQTPIAVRFVNEGHAITRGLSGWTTINEELYNNSEGKLLDTATALARGVQTFKNRQGEEITNDFVVAWTNAYRDKTRVFATTLGHNTQTVADPRYLDFITNGLLWSCDKLNEDYLKKTNR